MRLIDADALMESAGIFELKACARGCGKSVISLAKAWLFSEVEKAPTIDAEPVKHSQWKYYHKQGKAVCMNCSFERNLDDNFGRAVACPNCGAKM